MGMLKYGNHRIETNKIDSSPFPFVHRSRVTSTTFLTTSDDFLEQKFTQGKVWQPGLNIETVGLSLSLRF